MGMTREEAINKLEYLINSPVGREEIDETCYEVMDYLSAQEPRVMTLDELSEKTDVWFESLVYDTIAPALSSGSYDDGTVGLMTLEEESFYMDEADYGTKWRCWTSRPTDEQREATPWI